MTNEELAIRIQQGQTELIPTLWEQVERFIRDKAWRRAQALEGFGGVEVDDLYQSGFFALLEAVRAFDTESGYTFITYLVRPLKTAFADATGYRTQRQKNDPLQRCADLDAPIGEDDDGETLGDLIADPAAQEPFDDMEVVQLRTTLRNAVEGLPGPQRDAIIARYYLGLALNQEGRKNEAWALRTLRHPKVSRELQALRN